MEQKIEINGVGVLFEISVSINARTTEKPTGFTMNYIKTLAEMSGEHFGKQIGDAIIERIKEDFKKYPKNMLWKIENEVKG